MTRVFFYIVFYLSVFTTAAQVPTISWEKSIGGSNTDKVEKIIATHDGGYAVVGYSYSNDFDVPSNNGDWDIFVSKISYNGMIEWTRSFGGTGEDEGFAIQELNNGDFMICGTTIGYDPNFLPNYGHTDIVLIKLNKEGNLLWKKNKGGSKNDFCRDMIKTSDGNLIIAGSSGSLDIDATINRGNTDFWIVKIDTSATILWQKSYGGDNEELAYSIMETNDKGFVVVGQSRSEIDTVNNYGEADAFVFKIDAVGYVIWQKHFGGSANDKFRSALQLADNSFLIIGDTYSFDYDATQNHGQGENRDSFVVKLSATGETEWIRCYGGSSEDDARKAFQTSDGLIVMLNQIHSSSNDGDITTMYGQADFWLLKIDLSGNILWQKNYGSSGHEEPTCMLYTPDDGFIFVGNAYPYIDHDITHGYGNDDIWIAKLVNQEHCQPHLNLSNAVYYNTANFQAQTKISSTVKILNQGSSIHYKAGESILLNPGFEVKTANTFEAAIESCQQYH